MSVPPQLPPPTNSALLPVLASVTYLAAVIAAWGLLSLALDRNVIDYPDAGPLLGPAMAAAATVVTWGFAWGGRGGRASILSIGALAASYLVMILVGAIGYSSAPFFVTLVHFGISPFVAVAALLSALTVLATRALARPRPRGSSN